MQLQEIVEEVVNSPDPIDFLFYDPNSFTWTQLQRAAICLGLSDILSDKNDFVQRASFWVANSKQLLGVLKKYNIGMDDIFIYSLILIFQKVIELAYIPKTKNIAYDLLNGEINSEIHQEYICNFRLEKQKTPENAFYYINYVFVYFGIPYFTLNKLTCVIIEIFNLRKSIKNKLAHIDKLSPEDIDQIAMFDNQFNFDNHIHSVSSRNPIDFIFLHFLVNQIFPLVDHEFEYNDQFLPNLFNLFVDEIENPNSHTWINCEQSIAARISTKSLYAAFLYLKCDRIKILDLPKKLPIMILILLISRDLIDFSEYELNSEDRFLDTLVYIIKSDLTSEQISLELSKISKNENQWPRVTKAINFLDQLNIKKMAFKCAKTNDYEIAKKLIKFPDCLPFLKPKESIYHEMIKEIFELNSKYKGEITATNLIACWKLSQEIDETYFLVFFMSYDYLVEKFQDMSNYMFAGLNAINIPEFIPPESFEDLFLPVYQYEFYIPICIIYIARIKKSFSDSDQMVNIASLYSCYNAFNAFIDKKTIEDNRLKHLKLVINDDPMFYERISQIFVDKDSTMIEYIAKVVIEEQKYDIFNQICEKSPQLILTLEFDFSNYIEWLIENDINDIIPFTVLLDRGINVFIPLASRIFSHSTYVHRIINKLPITNNIANWIFSSVPDNEEINSIFALDVLIHALNHMTLKPYKYQKAGEETPKVEDDENNYFWEEDSVQSDESKKTKDEYQMCCTACIFQKKYITQPWFSCYTCNKVNHEGVCLGCAMTCHKDHDLVINQTSGFYCDCHYANDIKCQWKDYSPSLIDISNVTIEKLSDNEKETPQKISTGEFISSNSPLFPYIHGSLGTHTKGRPPIKKGFSELANALVSAGYGKRVKLSDHQQEGSTDIYTSLMKRMNNEDDFSSGYDSDKLPTCPPIPGKKFIDIFFNTFNFRKKMEAVHLIEPLSIDMKDHPLDERPVNQYFTSLHLSPPVSLRFSLSTNYGKIPQFSSTNSQKPISNIAYVYNDFLIVAESNRIYCFNADKLIMISSYMLTCPINDIVPCNLDQSTFAAAGKETIFIMSISCDGSFSLVNKIDVYLESQRQAINFILWVPEKPLYLAVILATVILIYDIPVDCTKPYKILRTQMVLNSCVLQSIGDKDYYFLGTTGSCVSIIPHDGDFINTSDFVPCLISLKAIGTKISYDEESEILYYSTRSELLICRLSDLINGKDNVWTIPTNEFVEFCFKLPGYNNVHIMRGSLSGAVYELEYNDEGYKFNCLMTHVLSSVMSCCGVFLNKDKLQIITKDYAVHTLVLEDEYSFHPNISSSDLDNPTEDSTEVKDDDYKPSPKKWAEAKLEMSSISFKYEGTDCSSIMTNQILAIRPSDPTKKLIVTCHNKNLMIFGIKFIFGNGPKSIICMGRRINTKSEGRAYVFALKNEEMKPGQPVTVKFETETIANLAKVFIYTIPSQSFKENEAEAVSSKSIYEFVDLANEVCKSEMDAVQMLCSLALESCDYDFEIASNLARYMYNGNIISRMVKRILLKIVPKEKIYEVWIYGMKYALDQNIKDESVINDIWTDFILLPPETRVNVEKYLWKTVDSTVYSERNLVAAFTCS